MAHQEAVTIVAEIRDGHVDALKNKLGTLREHGGNRTILPFPQLERVHFAQLVVFDAATDLDGQHIPAHFGLLSHVDAPAAAHLDELSSVCAESLDSVFSHCTDYPAEADRSVGTRRRFLEAHSLKADAVHVNRQGRTVQQIRREDGLRRELNKYLDAANLDGTAVDIRDRIIGFVNGRRDLSWALESEERPSLGWRVRHRLHAVFFSLMIVVLAPLLVLAAPFFLVMLRRHEQRERVDTSAAPGEFLRGLRDDEDFGAQNQMMAIGCLKRGVFRRTMMRAVMWVTDFATRHVYNRGILSGLNTIHFARWVTLNDGRRMIFCSNYDGSIESYMNDFIDKAAWGLNLIFSSGEGFPATVYGVGKGITDEKAYKRYLPTRLVRTGVWYSAYPHLTTKNITNNEVIRKGLSGRMREEEAQQWLKRFGSGNQLPDQSTAARILDGLPWDRICRRWN